ncbi:hypothetical protein BEWA_026260 [Theileria equi strain WA]|uniref:Uncharacterized protein n=1 Tax=Theileria equi strain WA TaxID=1537102 RepID=L0AVZ5_THEEQ|nr:hypothetical protein BEWA_026260 [Theileria equi strain WA]AFZ79777.1 hypothetical protein BEWA_026260 [Theileria equi strain WA]|eukprot:XP_004829443.1 hypothetical protein BEWA_026260 [Theileria equi strain WA]
MSVGVLTLNIKNKCQAGSCSCGKTPDKFGLKVSKETTIPNVTGFVRYTHELDDGNTFTLKGELNGNERLEGGRSIENVREVSVFYWDGDEDGSAPLILEVVKGPDARDTEYYIRYEYGEQEISGSSETVWKHHGYIEGKPLQDRLDDRNLARNQRIPFGLENPTKYRNFGSDRSKGKRVQLASLKSLNGSEYTVTTYNIIDQDLRLSRIEYDKEKIDIPIPANTLDGIRLYSSSGISQVPLMIEFKPVSGGDSTFHASKSETTWNTVDGRSEDFYYGKDLDEQTPKEALANKLDELACFYYNAVTIDLSYDISTGKSNWYCCNKHNSNEKVHVEQKHVYCRQDRNKSSITAYKHSINGGKLSGIKFYLSSDHSKQNRKRITSGTLKLPADGPLDIYTFYCQGNNPVLVYIHYRSSQGNSGWYRKQSRNGDNRPWKRTGPLSSIKSNHLEKEGLNCKQWNKLVDELKKLKCNVSHCPENSKSLPSVRAEGVEKGQESVTLSDGDGDEDEENEESDDEVTEELTTLGLGISAIAGQLGASVLGKIIDKALPETFGVTKDLIESTAPKLWAILSPDPPADPAHTSTAKVTGAEPFAFATLGYALSGIPGNLYLSLVILFPSLWFLKLILILFVLRDFKLRLKL